MLSTGLHFASESTGNPSATQRLAVFLCTPKVLATSSIVYVRWLLAVRGLKRRWPIYCRPCSLVECRRRAPSHSSRSCTS